jgi:hypothetical protein
MDKNKASILVPLNTDFPKGDDDKIDSHSSTRLSLLLSRFYPLFGLGSGLMFGIFNFLQLYAINGNM